jgi:hypothetical protein
MKNLRKAIATLGIWGGFGAMTHFVTSNNSTHISGATVCLWMFGSSD